MPESEHLASLGKMLERRVASKLSTEEYIKLPVDAVFEEIPVDLDAFLYTSAYLNIPVLSQKQYDFVKFGTQVYYEETLAGLGWDILPYVNYLVACWGKGSGKDTVARIVLSRIAYLLMCLRDPQQYLDVMPGDSINMLNIAYSSDQAQNIFFEPLKKMLERSPWFKDKINPQERVVKFVKDINLFSGHSEQESQEGHNLIAGVLDEIAAFKTKAELERQQRRTPRPLQHSAEAISDMISESARSRFPKLFKEVFLSYTRFQGDFIMQKYDEGLNNPKWFVSKGATWEVNPKRKEEDFVELKVKNPEKYRQIYMCDPPMAIDRYFKKLDDALINEVFPKIEMEPVDDMNRLRPFVRGIPGVHYFGHIDIGISNNNAGICIVHRAGFVEVIMHFVTPEGIESEQIIRLPKIKVDLWTSFEAPINGEIDLSEIRELIFKMHDHLDFFIALLTFDKFQSADSRQILEKKGIATDLLSVDKDTVAYDTLKDVIYTKRLYGYYRALGVSELQRLTIITGSKVDHPLEGSKDEADALAGAVYNAIEAPFSDAIADDIDSGGAYNEIFGSFDSRLNEGMEPFDAARNSPRF